MKTTIGKSCSLPWGIVSFLIGAMFLLCATVQAQQSTVVIAEVMYDNPLYDNETLAPGKESEFMSLYNYGEDSVNIGGWHITVTPLTIGHVQFSYTIPANTILSESGLLVIASRSTIGSFNVGNFYGQVVPDPDSSGIRVLYTNTLAYPDTRSQIAVYDAQNQLQDALMYDGMSAAQPGSPLLRAENAVNPQRPLSSTVSIQREKIAIKDGIRNVSKTDYYAYGSEQPVQLFNYLPDDYSETPFPSTMASPPPEKLTLNGTVTKNKNYEAPTIESTQIIESGKTTYFAGDGITLGPGFEVKAGAEFHADVEPDSFHLVTMLTYNLWGKHTEYDIHGMVIRESKASVVAVQEVWRPYNFKKLKIVAGLKGKMFATIAGLYGIGMLWNPDIVGSPVKKDCVRIKTPDDKYDSKRAFMIAEFKNFCFVSTHYSTDSNHRKEMSKKILNHKLVRKCLENNKPIYIAGDMNARRYETPIKMFTNVGFEVLNDSSTEDSMIDLILVHNANPNHKTLERGKHLAPFHTWWESGAGNHRISDHKPYRVKVKIK